MWRMSSAFCTKEMATAFSPMSRPSCRSLMSFSVRAGRAWCLPGKAMPLREDSMPALWACISKSRSDFTVRVTVNCSMPSERFTGMPGASPDSRPGTSRGTKAWSPLAGASSGRPRSSISSLSTCLGALAISPMRVLGPHRSPSAVRGRPISDSTSRMIFMMGSKSAATEWEKLSLKMDAPARARAFMDSRDMEAGPSVAMILVVMGFSGRGFAVMYTGSGCGCVSKKRISGCSTKRMRSAGLLCKTRPARTSQC